MVFFISDQTGVTAETLGHSLLTQFNGSNFRQVTLPFVDSEDKAREAVEQTHKDTGLPCTDPIRFGPKPLLDAILD